MSSPQPCLDGDDEESMTFSPMEVVSESDQLSLVLPGDDVEVDNQLSISQMLKAYAEAMEMEQELLSGELIRRLKEKACVTGSKLERLAHYLVRALGREEDFLAQEASRNYEAAFKAFYQIFPYGRFAHFTANSAILGAMPENAEVVGHIVDFDIGNGVQWPPLIETLARRGHRAVRLISVKWEEVEENGNCISSCPKFEETKMRLTDHAGRFGLMLRMEEMDMEELQCEMKKAKKRGGRRESLAFSCMVGLPHMGRGRSARHVVEYLKVAKESISGCSIISNRGIIMFGDGIGWGKGLKGVCNGYISIFEEQLIQFHALMEQLDSKFPDHLREASIAMECLFMTPYIACLAGFEVWQDITREIGALSEVGLETYGLSRGSLMEAKELVREGGSLYWVSIEGVKENQMVLGYRGTPLVKVSSWS